MLTVDQCLKTSCSVYFVAFYSLDDGRVGLIPIISLWPEAEVLEYSFEVDKCPLNWVLCLSDQLK